MSQREPVPNAPRKPLHLRPTATLAERVLLPGDPGRALALAQALLEQPLMFNHHRGLWGYTGTASDGQALTIQSTGMGGPSAAIVVQELIALGARRAVRVGTCGALDGGLRLGELVVAGEALAADGTSRMLGAHGRVAADDELTSALERAAAREAATIVTTDLFYDPDCERELDWRSAGAVAVEMEAAALFTIGARADVRVGCVLAVSDLIEEGRRTRIGDDALLVAADAMGQVALQALSA